MILPEQCGDRDTTLPVKFDNALSPYSVDTITIKGFEIGYVTGMAIIRNKKGSGDSWKLDKVAMATGESVMYN